MIPPIERMDICVFGGRNREFVLDVRVFDPFAPSNKQSTLPSIYTKHERGKEGIWSMSSRYRVCNFHPLGSLTHWWFGKEGILLLQGTCLSSLSTTTNWIRCCFSFALLRSSIHCIRGAHFCCSHATKVPTGPSVDVVHSF